MVLGRGGGGGGSGGGNTASSSSSSSPSPAPASALAAAAASHSADMAASDTFSHASSGNRGGLGERASRAGFATFPLGENIAAGYGSVRGAVLAWACSPGHRANLLACGFDAVGSGVAASGASASSASVDGASSDAGASKAC